MHRFFFFSSSTPYSFYVPPADPTKKGFGLQLSLLERARGDCAAATKLLQAQLLANKTLGHAGEIVARQREAANRMHAQVSIRVHTHAHAHAYARHKCVHPVWFACICRPFSSCMVSRAWDLWQR